jgi:Transport and Golgi organisation 2
MCTVIYIPTATGFLVSSNRDEAFARKTAIPPDTFTLATKEVVMPVDREAGGSWVAATSNREVLVLFNGGFIAHPKNSSYRLSRGVIFKQLVGAVDSMALWNVIELQNIEPFSLIMINQSVCNRLVWDGLNKHTIHFDPQKAHIWSSATLYTTTAIKMREALFNNWVSENNTISPALLSSFLKKAMPDDSYDGYVMNRNNSTGTVSISIVDWSQEKATFYYDDLRHSPAEPREIFFNKTTCDGQNTVTTIATAVV